MTTQLVNKTYMYTLLSKKKRPKLPKNLLLCEYTKLLICYSRWRQICKLLLLPFIDWLWTWIGCKLFLVIPLSNVHVLGLHVYFVHYKCDANVHLPSPLGWHWRVGSVGAGCRGWQHWRKTHRRVEGLKVVSYSQAGLQEPSILFRTAAFCKLVLFCTLLRWLDQEAVWNSRNHFAGCWRQKDLAKQAYSLHRVHNKNMRKKCLQVDSLR